MLKDFRNNVIRVGDTVVYPGRSSSSLWMTEGEVVGINDPTSPVPNWGLPSPSPTPFILVQTGHSRRLSKLTVLERVVVVGRRTR